MRSLVAVLLLVGVCCAATTREESLWKLYKATYQKSYACEAEDALRMKLFQENLKYIEEHNKLYEAGEKTFQMGMNQFTDLSLSEHNALHKGLILPDNPRKTKKERSLSDLVTTTTLRPIPEELDWRTYNVVTPIKNQGNCGSCWAFSATGALEAQLARRTGKLLSLSEQQLVDCTYKGKYGNYGCGGGWFEPGWQQIQDVGGIDSEESYPYTAKTGTSCLFNAGNVVGTDVGYVDLPPNDEDALLEAVGVWGPVSISVDATHASFMNYKSGVYYEPNCSSTQLDHAILIVGYGKDAASGMDYWIVKNSWGTWWGESGYIKMARNRNNNCGIATHPAHPYA